MTDCAAGSESCCTSLEVTTALESEASPFYRTYTNSGSGPTGEADPATVSGFRLDKYLVTVGRFRQFVAAWNNGYYPAAYSGKHTHLNGGFGLANSAYYGDTITQASCDPEVDYACPYETGWDAIDWNNATNIAPTDANLSDGVCDPGIGSATWTSTAGSNEDLPINCVNWYEAYAFCIWDGGFLPSDAEWEYAAAAGNQQRQYPWGSFDPYSTTSSYLYEVADCNYPPQGGGCGGIMNLAPVGVAVSGAGYWGQLDLSGEVWEWSLDVYGTYVDPCTDCAYLPTTFTARSERGGDVFADNGSLKTSVRDSVDPLTRNYALGFRCARTP
jgi:formylglycine-generating enzyme required for sulfatase activity